MGAVLVPREKRFRSLIGSAALVVSLIFMLPAPQGRADRPLFYDLTPLSDQDPSIRRALERLRESHPPKAAKKQPEGPDSELKRLQVFREKAPGVLTRHALLWLEGSLQRHEGRPEASRAIFEQLVKVDGSLADLAAVELKDLASDAAQASLAVDRLFEIGPWIPRHQEELKRAIRFLVDSGQIEKAALGISRTLDRALSRPLRSRLEKRLVELWRKVGHAGKAKGLLMRIWWESKSERARTSAWNTLRELKAKPSFYAQISRIALQANRGSVGSAKKKLRMFPGRNSHQKRMRRWAESVLNRHRSDRRLLTVKKMGRMRKHIRKNAEPYFLFGYALVLQSAGDGLRAGALFHEIAHNHPGHHLAVEAALQAGRLLSARGQEAEGLGAYQRAIQTAPRGPFHRNGLWEVGFASLLSGGYKRAEVLMGDLLVRYGGEREALGILWAEKAGYWQARASELDGKLKVAALRYRRLIANFPVSWYALWSQKRLDSLLVTGRVRPMPSGESSVGMRVFERDWADIKIVQRPALDAPVALLKLGFLVQARRALDSMLSAGELPGSGRLLLAALHHRSGRTERAHRLLRRGGVLVTYPERADADAFEAMFPREYREIIGTVSAEFKLSASVASGLVRIESRFNPRARSGAGATGLTQLMPKTARAVGRRLLGMRWVGRRLLRKPEPNLRIGLRYLKELEEHFQGHMPLALAAYNAGIGAARSWWRKLPRPTTDVFVEQIPYSQTRNYVRRVYSSAYIYGHLYGGTAPGLPLKLPESLGPYFEEK